MKSILTPVDTSDVSQSGLFKLKAESAEIAGAYWFVMIDAILYLVCLIKLCDIRKSHLSAKTVLRSEKNTYTLRDVISSGEGVSGSRILCWEGGGGREVLDRTLENLLKTRTVNSAL